MSWSIVNGAYDFKIKFYSSIMSTHSIAAGQEDSLSQTKAILQQGIKTILI